MSPTSYQTAPSRDIKFSTIDTCRILVPRLTSRQTRHLVLFASAEYPAILNFQQSILAAVWFPDLPFVKQDI